MAYNISKTLISRLPENERGTPDSIGQQLLDRSGGKCSLCDGDLNVAAEVLEADHNVPEAAGGLTTLDNLSLAHQTCNRTKKDLSNEQARPYLRFRRFIREAGGRIKYDRAAEHWGITPAPSHVATDDSGQTLVCSFADGSSTQVPVYTTEVGDENVRYAFLEVPQVALMNDQQVQPRNIRHAHAFSGSSDLRGD